ncbi:transcriptional regulator [Lysinibacillus sp. 1P01SD]|uniref:transcriptional regulator n=1 Tax=Lysinibacillus sp. 1P01SD TaxID=3132285 RepID=UPI0039A32CAE
MLIIREMKPIHSSITNGILHLVFDTQCISIEKDKEIFYFIPVGASEIIIDIKSKKILNLSDTFVFQKGRRFIRLAIYQFMFFSNANDFLYKIVIEEEAKAKKNNTQYLDLLKEETDYELASLFQAMEDDDSIEIQKSKNRLIEIQAEIEEINQKGNK